MGKYGLTAKIAADLLMANKAYDPIEAWRTAASQVFPNSLSSQVKSCPRSTFLGLCENGYIPNVAEGNYTRSKKNKTYAIKALSFIADNPELLSDKDKLWSKVLDGEKKQQNSQMDIIITLWNNGIINTNKLDSNY